MCRQPVAKQQLFTPTSHTLQEAYLLTPVTAFATKVKLLTSDKCLYFNLIPQNQKKVLKEDMTMSLLVVLHLMNTPASSAFWLPGRPSKQAAVGGSTANSVSKGLQELTEIVQVAVKIWMANASQTRTRVAKSTN